MKNSAIQPEDVMETCRWWIQDISMKLPENTAMNLPDFSELWKISLWMKHLRGKYRLIMPRLPSCPISNLTAPSF